MMTGNRFLVAKVVGLQYDDLRPVLPAPTSTDVRLVELRAEVEKQGKATSTALRALTRAIERLELQLAPEVLPAKEATG